MTARIFKDVIDPLFSEIEWIEQYGGLVIPTDLESKGDEQVSTYTYPRSTALDPAECKDSDLYLVPHKQKQALVYWEELEDVDIVESGNIPGGKAIEANQEVRLVCWYNTKQMGKDDPIHIRHRLMHQLLSILDGYHANNTPGPEIKLIRLSLTLNSFAEVRDTSIFDNYTYFPQYRQLFKLPYDFFAMTFDLNWVMWKSCIPIPELTDAITC